MEEELIKVRNELMATRSMASSSSSIILSTTTTASTSNSNHSNEVKELKKYNEDLSVRFFLLFLFSFSLSNLVILTSSNRLHI